MKRTDSIAHRRLKLRHKNLRSEDYLTGALSVHAVGAYVDDMSRTYQLKLSNGRVVSIRGDIGLREMRPEQAIQHQTDASAAYVRRHYRA